VKTYIFDIDGTLAEISHRLHFVEGENKDWDAFFAACVDDKPIQPVIDVCRALGLTSNHERFRIIYLTGRSDVVRRETHIWLFDKCHLPIGEVIMRKAGDHRPDTQAKKELMEKIIAEGDTICGVFEDRPSVCRVWRDMGLTVFQMNDKEF
jgi:hypothetical protein